MSITIETYRGGELSYEYLTSFSPEGVGKGLAAMSSNKELIRRSQIDLGYINTGRAGFAKFHPCHHLKVDGVVKLGSLIGPRTASSPSGMLPYGSNRTSGSYSFKVLDRSVHPSVSFAGGEYCLILPEQSCFCHYERYYRSKFQYRACSIAGVATTSHPLTNQTVYVFYNVEIISKNTLVTKTATIVYKYFSQGKWVQVMLPSPVAPTDIDVTSTQYIGAASYQQSLERVLLALRQTAIGPKTEEIFSSKIQLTGSTIPHTLDGIKNAVQSQLEQQIPPLPTDVEWGDLCQKAINGFRHVDINTAVWFKEIIGLKNNIKQALSLLKGDISPKSISKLFLSDKYGVKLTVQDTVELASQVKYALDNANSSYELQKSAAMATIDIPNGTRRVNYTVYAREPDNALLLALKHGLDWDVLPTLQNAWDMVPFSFVVDWFVDVEGFCQSIDTMIYEQYLDVQCVIFTYKDNYTVKLKPPFDGTLNVTCYHRHLADKLHKYYPDLDRNDRWKDNINVLTALIIVKS